jgi:hypothetical protein
MTSNRALDYFDCIARDNSSPALRIVASERGVMAR